MENGQYHQAVYNIMGSRYAVAVGVCQVVNIFLINITYTITCATSMVAIATMACGSGGGCFNKLWEMSALYGAFQLVLSQVPSLESAWWVSSLGAVTSITYSSVALGLGAKYVGGGAAGSVGGIVASPVNKVFGVLSALGGVAFAYSFAIILLEIQDTLKQPPKASKTMKPAASIGITMSFVFYFCVALVNYAAFGNGVQEFIFNSYPGPSWALYLGQSCIILHIATAYQVFAQPVYNTLESHVKAFLVRRAVRRGDHSLEDRVVAARCASARGRGAARPAEAAGDLAAESGAQKAPPSKESLDSKADPALARASPDKPTVLSRISSSVSTQVQVLGRPSSMYRVSTGLANEAMPLNEERFLLPLWQRIIIRSTYVLIATVIACIMPFFSDMAGLVGALSFFPLSIFFPIRCWRRLYRPTGSFSWMLWALEITMGIVSLLATIASIRGIINNASSYKLFG